MKNINKMVLNRILISAIFLTTIISVLIGKQIPNRKQKYEVIDGIKTIKNPSEPLYGEIVFDLKEDLNIGKEDDENYAFFKGAGLNVDREGNIFAFDYANLRVQKFDKNGHFLLTIGRKGQGPGEFQTFNGSYFDSRDNLYIGQSRGIIVYKSNGKLRHTITGNTQILSFMIPRENNLIISTLSRNEGDNDFTDDILLINSQGKTIKKIASFATPKLSMTGKVAVGAFNLYNPFLYFRPLGDEFGVYGFSSEYKLTIINSAGEIVQIIEKKENPETISEKEKDAAIDRELESLKDIRIKINKSDISDVYNFPPHKPFFYGIIIDDRGDIYLFKMRKGPEGKTERFYDLFSKDGYYIYRVFIKEKLFPTVIANKCVYCVKENEEAGIYEIKRYKIINWEQIESKLTDRSQ